MRLSDKPDYPSPDLVGSNGVPNPDPLRALKALADDLARSSRAPNTRRAYESAWKNFSEWSSARGLVHLPAAPEIVAMYLAYLVTAQKRMSTILSALTAVSQRHLDAGYPSPRNDPHVRKVVAGIRRRCGSEQHSKSAITGVHVEGMVAALGTHLRDLRDRAVIALGFATGMRRGEIVALNVADLAWVEAGLLITISVSKRNDRARRVRVSSGLGPVCAVSATRAWLDAAGLKQGPVFRRVSSKGALGGAALQDRAVARLIKRVAVSVGLDPKRVSGHSLRSGYATASARAGVSPGQIQRTLGHSSAGMTVRYIRDSDQG